MFKGLGLVAALVMVPGLALAEMQVQKCVMETGRGDHNTGILSDEYYTLVDTKTGAMQVADPILEHFNKGPTAVVVSKDDATVTVFAWSVFVVNNAGQRTKMAFRATLFKATHEIDIIARPAGYRNTFQVRGTCAPYVPN